MHRPRRCRVRELSDRAHNPAPDHRTVVIAGLCKLVGALRALQFGILAVALEHELGDAPYVDVRDHGGKLSGGPISTVNPPVPALPRAGPLQADPEELPRPCRRLKRNPSGLHFRRLTAP
jgi:hypothetical protein